MTMVSVWIGANPFLSPSASTNNQSSSSSPQHSISNGGFGSAPQAPSRDMVYVPVKNDRLKISEESCAPISLLILLVVDTVCC